MYLEDQTAGKKSVKNEGASVVWRDVATMSLADGDESKSAEVTSKRSADRPWCGAPRDRCHN
jgi:hypothetical protein